MHTHRANINLTLYMSELGTSHDFYTAHTLIHIDGECHAVSLLSSAWQAASSLGTPGHQAAALAVTCRSLQLASLPASDVLQLQTALQTLLQPAQSALHSDSGWHWLALAEGLQLSQSTGNQVCACRVTAITKYYCRPRGQGPGKHTCRNAIVKLYIAVWLYPHAALYNMPTESSRDLCVW